MFDAAGAATGEAAAHPDVPFPQADHAQPGADPAFLEALAQAVPAAAALPDTAPARAADAPAAAPPVGDMVPATAPPTVSASDGAGRHEVMFVDPTVADYQTLVDGARPGVEVVVLDPSRDGLVQMAEYLEGRSGIDSVQIMAHGSAGRFALGAVDVNADTLRTHGAELAIIGRALTEHGDLLIYACNTGAGIDGQGFVIDLARATGADVAASSDNTGAAALGGNWVLETRAGTIESTVALTARAQDRYTALMTATFTQLTGSANTVSALGTVTSKTFIAADFDGDGDTDFIFRNNSASPTGVDFWRNSGGVFTKFSGAVSGNPFSAITWSGPNSAVLAANFSPFSMLAADVDGDGDIDVVNMASGSARGIWLNNSGIFAYATNSPTLPTVTANTQSLAGDFDGDGDIDVIVRNNTGAPTGVNFWRNDGGTFTLVSSNASNNPFSAVTFAALAANFDARFMAAGDVDGDGDIDVINMTGSANPGRGIWLNHNGVFSIVSAGGLPVATTSGQFVAGDFDGDGDTDIAFRNASGTGIDFYRASGGTFSLDTSANPFSAIVFSPSGANNFNADSMTAFDIDGDGDLDIVNLTTSAAGRGSFRNDLTPPQLTSVVIGGVTVSNTDNPTGAATTPTITLTFNKSIQSAGTGKISIREYGTGTLVGSAVTGTDTAKVSGVGSGSTITITPGVTLSASTRYYLQIDKGAFFDSDGATLGRVDVINNTTMGLTGKTLFDFTTISNTTPTLDLNTGTGGTGNTVTLAGAASGLADATAIAADAENDGANWNGATLTVKRTATAGTANGAWSSDVFGFTGASGITIDSGDLKSGSTTIGTVTNSGGALTIAFNGSATTALVNSVVRGVTYGNSAPAGNATIAFALTDGSGGSTSADVTVTSSTIHVTSTTDSTAIDATDGVSFSEAVAIANAQSGADTLVLGSGFTGAMTLAGNLTVGESLTVNADAAGGWTVQDGTRTITLDSGVTLTVTNSGGTVTIGAGLAGAGSLTKTGAGTLALSGSGSYAGTTTVSAGTLLVNGTLDPSGNVSVASGATLGGTGTVFSSGSKQVTILDGATLAPGVAGTNNGIGTLTINGNLRINGGLAIEIGGSGGVAGTDYDQVAVNGTVSLNGGSLTVSRVNGYTATDGTVFRIIDNDSTDTVGGSPATFGGIAEGTDTTLGGDLYTVRYAGGTGNDVTLSAVVNPTVSSVSATTANGAYRAGDTVAITVTFSRSVTVTGTPTLALGNNGRTAAYGSGSGGTTLTFTYTVQAGDGSADLDYLSTSALALNGGTINDSGSGLAAVLTLAPPGAANSLGANRNIVIDTIGPAVVSVAAPANGTYGAGRTMDFVVTFNETVSVDGVPTLPITLDNGQVVQATYLSGAGGTALTFRYTVGSGALDTDGIAFGTALGGGTVRDTAGNNATATLNGVAATSGVRIDGAAPMVTAVTSSTANGAYTTGDTITLQVSFSEAVTVTGTPTLALDTGRTAVYSGGSGGGTLTFTYTVQAGDTSADLDALGSGALAGGIADAAGNGAVLTLPGGPNSLGAGKDIVIDTRTPEVVGVTVPNDGIYGTGKTLSVFVSVSERVTVAGGTPTIALDIGGVPRQAVYNAAGSAGTVLRFDYVVQAGDTDADGIAIGALSLNGATIADAARNPLPATLANVPGTQGVRIDTVPPAAPSAPVLAPGSDSGASASDLVTNVTRPTLTGTAEAGSTVTVLVDGVARGTATAGANGAWSLTLSTPLAEGARTITTTATDAAGNSGPASSALVVTIDATPPVLSIPTLAAGSDNGISTTDRVISVTRPTLTGMADPNGTVTVLIDGAAAGTATAGRDGVWIFTVADALADGDHGVQAIATDRAGNTGRSANQTITIRTAPPATPPTPLLSAGSDSGASPGDALTNVTRPTLSGTAEPNGTVTLFIDGAVAGTARTDANGAWSLTLATALSDGTHRIQVGVTDVVGNSGAQWSGTLVVTVDGQAPVIAAGLSATSLGGGTTVAIGAEVTLSDASPLDRVTVTLTDARGGDELVIGALPGGIAATRDGGRVVLSGVASVADYQAALRAVGLRSTVADPAFGGMAPSRSITVSARDAAGNESGVATVTVPVVSAVTAVTPSVATNTGTNSIPLTISGNGPSTNTATSSGLSGGLSSAPSLPGDAASPGSDTGRLVTLGSLGGGVSSGDTGRSVTLGSLGGDTSSGDTGRAVTLSSLGGRPGDDSSSSASGLSGGAGSGASFGSGFGGLGTGSGLVTGLGTGVGMGASRPFGAPPDQRLPAQGTGLGSNRPDSPPPSEPNVTPNAGQAGNPDGERGETSTPPDGNAQQTQGSGTGGRAEAPTIRFAPGFAHQVACIQGGPASASALLAALANHVLPGSRAV
ncbi:Ig-like domain-containing protein [Azospirillum doebereinerae]|uniref:Ig-like domain-containing protein n=1 Tax=Azospirillum doebereinerae TaxID=92933 RepID=UPI00163BA74D|nr:Ig-like domain-containing protein [Azospirillum doebereinerae]